MRILMLSILILFFLGVQCTKDEEDDPGQDKNGNQNVTKMDPDFLTFFNFPEGSYWIYEEANSGKMDSAYIKWRNRRVYEPNAKPDGQKDYKIETFALHEVIKDSIYYGHASSVYIKENRIFYVYKYRKTIQQNTVTWYMLEKYSDMTYAVTDTIRDKIELKLLDSFTVNEKKYNEVLEVGYEPYLNIPFRRIWYAKGIGAIRRDFRDGTSWRLVRYHHAND